MAAASLSEQVADQMLRVLASNEAAVRELGAHYSPAADAMPFLTMLPDDVAGALSAVAVANDAARGLARLAVLNRSARAAAAASPVVSANERERAPKRERVFEAVARALINLAAHDVSRARVQRGLSPLPAARRGDTYDLPRQWQAMYDLDLDDDDEKSSFAFHVSRHGYLASVLREVAAPQAPAVLQSNEQRFAHGMLDPDSDQWKAMKAQVEPLLSEAGTLGDSTRLNEGRVMLNWCSAMALVRRFQTTMQTREGMEAIAAAAFASMQQ